MRRKNRKAKNTQGEGRGRSLLLKAAPFIVAVLLVAGFLGYLRYGRGFFPLRKVVFTGNRNLSSGELFSLLNVKKGQNMLGFSKTALSRRLLANPWVKNAAVRNEILSGRILVRVEERQPFVLIRREGVTWLADIQGRLLEPVREGVTPFLPVIQADVKNYRDTFKEAMLLARLLKIRGYFQRPIVIEADTFPEDLSLKAGDVVIKVGFGDYEQKLDKLAELESEIQKRGIQASTIDLRFANRVFVTPVMEVRK
ncbi:MAG: FtsQ-type POTRA domain-containing protein [Nitrospiraceae bacterium]|nr:FtsQ-type POTRA domain-containing protein [Nitrospiraceae bacterium]